MLPTFLMYAGYLTKQLYEHIIITGLVNKQIIWNTLCRVNKRSCFEICANWVYFRSPNPKDILTTFSLVFHNTSSQFSLVINNMMLHTRNAKEAIKIKGNLFSHYLNRGTGRGFQLEGQDVCFGNHGYICSLLR